MRGKKGNAPVEKHAWTIRSFANSIEKSRSWLYALPADKQPGSVRVGRSRLITEHPQDFLDRIAEKAVVS